MSIIIFLAVLSVLVFVHELGHFLVAKATGMRVDEFAIGFPPRLVSKTIGETKYSINLLPLGGFVKIYGENPAEVADEGTDGFLQKPKLSRFAVLSAGVLGNFLFAWLTLSILFMVGIAAPASDSEIAAGSSTATVVSVLAGSPAEQAGLQTGDSIVGIHVPDTAVSTEHISSEYVITTIQKHSDSLLQIEVLRDGTPLSFEVMPAEGIIANGRAIGVSFADIVSRQYSFSKAIVAGYTTSISIIKNIVSSMVVFFGDVFTGADGTLAQVAGPVGIAGMVGEASSAGFSQLLMLMAIISLDLAVLNLIPFPALDGGQIVFVLWETVTGKKIKHNIIGIANTVGFVFLIGLMIVITVSDVIKLF